VPSRPWLRGRVLWPALEVPDAPAYEQDGPFTIIVASGSREVLEYSTGAEKVLVDLRVYLPDLVSRRGQRARSDHSARHLGTRMRSRVRSVYRRARNNPVLNSDLRVVRLQRRNVYRGSEERGWKQLDRAMSSGA
jgi:hypothetical protein